MKIRSLALNQFKKFTSPMCLNDIGDGLNVVVGPNEMGKSTLLDALRAALFEKYSSKAKSITALQNDRNQAAPVVELAFEVDDGIYRVRKRFVKKPYAQLFCPDGRKLEGDEAEDTLRDLLGFDDPGKTGAKPETLGMWNVLWVQQGQSFGALDLPDSARSNLHSALESEVGAVLGGKRGRALPDAVNKQLLEFVTATGKPRGEHKELIKQLEKQQAELEELRRRRRELSKTLEDLEAAQETLTRISLGERDQADKGELADARYRHAELAKLETTILAATTEVELRQRDLKQAQQALADRGDLKAQIETDAGTIALGSTSLEEVRHQEEKLRERLEELRKVVKEAETAVTRSDEAASLARRILSAVQRDSRIRELQERYKKAHDAEKKQRAAQQGAAAILVTDENIDTIRGVAKELDSARSRLSAAATVISFDMPSDRLSKIQVDGATSMADRTTLRAVETATITIPDYGSISVQPAIKDRDKLLDQQQQANDALKSALEECGTKSLDAAEEQFSKRQRLLQEADLAQQETELHAPAADEYKAGAEPLADYVEGLKTILERELAELGIQDLPTEKKADDALLDVQARAQVARDATASARASCSGPEEELDRVQTELVVGQTRYEDGQVRLERLKNRLVDAEKQGSENDLNATVSAADTALDNQVKVVSDLEDQRTGETLPQLEARISRLDQAIHDRREKRSELKQTIAGSRSLVDVLEGAGLDEAIQQKAREVELAEAQRQRRHREVGVLTLLLATLRTAESAAKEQYLSPVLKRVRPYLQLLFPGAEIAIDENLRIVGVKRQDGYEEAFDHLSVGTQEQIAVLVRLAFAEMLVEQGHPATVVLDDALVFSDDQRMGRMFDILNVVAQRVQIIVFTCREQLFEGVGGHRLSLKTIETEELASA